MEFKFVKATYFHSSLIYVCIWVHIRDDMKSPIAALVPLKPFKLCKCETDPWNGFILKPVFIAPSLCVWHTQPICLRHRLQKCRQTPLPYIITEIKPGLTLALMTWRITEQEENCHLGGNRFPGDVRGVRGRWRCMGSEVWVGRDRKLSELRLQMYRDGLGIE
jgi:hypothetical protein